MMCTDENNIEELTRINCPMCWQRCDKDPSGFKKMMVCEIVKEFICKASSTCPFPEEKRANVSRTGT